MSKLKHERTCVVCGTKYSYCSHCGEYNPKETWRYVYCSLNCKAVFNACSGFAFGDLTKAEARKLLKKCDLSKREQYGKHLKANLKDIGGV